MGLCCYVDKDELKMGFKIYLRKLPLRDLYLSLGWEFGSEADDFNLSRSKVIHELGE